jgi:hypothetical protein
MRRRDFVKAMVAVPVTAKTMFGQQTAAPLSAATAVQPPAAETAPTATHEGGYFDYKAHPIPSSVPDGFATTQANFFNEQQMATLRKLCDVLLPPLNGYPGASQAGAPEFLDFLIGASPADRKHMYRAGLDRLNADAKKQFHVPFAQVSAEQADKLIRPWLRAWMPEHPPKEQYAHFINLAHQDIRTATMNSQAWSIAATSTGARAPGIGLYWSPIDPDIQMYV